MSTESKLLAGLLKEMRVSLRDLQEHTGIVYRTLRQYALGEKDIPRAHAAAIARALFPERMDRQDALVEDLCPVRKATISRRPRDLSVRALQYGHLTVDEITRPIDPKVSYSGPMGLLIDLFQRFSLIGDCDQLRPFQVRPTLKQALCSEATNHAYLGNLATIDRLRTDYFFCTPITIGTQGLIRADDRLSKERVTAIREALAFPTRGRSCPIAPIYMPNEIGHHLVRALLGEVKSFAGIEDLSVSECVAAFAKADVPPANKHAVLLMDELTCLLVASQYDGGAVALAFPDFRAPRYPFGFSIPRGNEELRRWFKVALELYLQTDHAYVVDLFLRLYTDLVEFAKQLNKRSRDPASDFFPDPQAWAARVLGVDVPELRSTLVCRAWQPIVETVHRKIRPTA